MHPIILALLFLAASCGVVRAAAFDVSVHVEDIGGVPVCDACVWLGPQTAMHARTDGNGDAAFVAVEEADYMIVVRHPDYGRTDARFVGLVGNTNVAFVLPPLSVIRVASYNVKGYDAWDDSQILPLARVLWTVQPDIVCVQECPENGTPTDDIRLDEFQKTYLPGYTNIVSSVGGPIHNGIISFYPIEGSFSEGASEMIRDLYGAEIMLPHLHLATFMSAHFKCCGGTANGEKRNQEARFVGSFCSNLYVQDKLFVLGADLNDDPAYPRPPSNVHGILTNAGAGLVELKPRDDPGSPITYPAARRYDFIIPVSNIAELVVTTYVFRTDTMINRPAWLSPNETSEASDHCLIYADFLAVPEPGAFAVLMIAFCGRFATWRRRN